jgi:hypothetical protein
MILKAGLILVAIEADRMSEKLQSYVKLLRVAILCSLCNTAYFSLFYQFVTGMCPAMAGEKAHLVFVLQISNLLKLITQLLENMGIPGGGGGGGGGGGSLAHPPQFVWQTKPVGQYSLHSPAILAYYKNKWDKFC